MDMNPPENPVEGKETSAPKIWNYETFKEYLMSQVKGSEYLLPLNDFPEDIELSLDWHKILNLMRNKTGKDQIERVALAGYNLTNRTIYLPTERVVEISWQWERNAPVSITAIEIQRAYARSHGAEGFVGILHSHPSHDIGIHNLRLKTGRLSAGDLYIALLSGYGSMIGVAAGGINSFAFRAKESITPRESKDKFYDLWEGEPQPRNLDRVIAQNYNLALFRGNENGVLKRVYPR